MTGTPIWTKLLGVLSILPVVYFWLVVLGPKSWLAHYPGKPASILLAILCSVPLSAGVAKRGSRLWYLVTAMAAGTLLFIGLRLH